MGLLSFLGLGSTGTKPEDAKQMLDEGAVLLDVREDSEWKAGHAPGAVHIPLSKLPNRFAKLSKDKKVLTVCKMGGRSAKAANILRQEGYDVLDVKGGMTAWARTGLPVVDDRGRPGRVA